MATTKHSTIRKVSGLALAFALGVGIAGCQGGSPGAAAYVDGSPILERDVTAAINQVKLLTGNDVGRSDMVLSLVSTDLYMAAGDLLGIEVDEKVVDDQLQLVLDQAGSDLSLDQISPLIRDIFYSSALSEQINTDGQGVEFQEALNSIGLDGIDLNPRYGEFVEDQYVAPSTVGDGFGQVIGADN